MKYRTLLLVILLIAVSSGMAALDHTPGQLLFKTARSLEIQRGRTGLTEFDSFLDQVQAMSVRPVKGMPGSRWFAADLAQEPDWTAIRSGQKSFDGIDIIQPNYLNRMHVTPNDPWYTLQQMHLVNLPEAWNYTTGSSMILAGVVDSGILKDHPDLQNNIYYNPNEIPDNGIDDDNNGYIDDYCGWDFADAPELYDQALGDYLEQDNDVTDENFHGTHVSGILGAVSNNGVGVSGVCWSVKLLPLRAGFRTTSGTGFLQDDDAAAAIIYGADMGCSVMNLSWGDANYSAIIADACQYAYERGIVLVASAGNDPGPYLSYPAKLSCVISVGAIDPYRNLAGFSSYGQELDLVAPGQEIYSTYKLEGVDQYMQMSGTSMSSPFVAGSVALLKSLQPNLSPDEVRACLLSSTDDLGDDGFDIRFGHGLLNVQKLLENTSSPFVSVTYPADNIGISEDFDIIGTVSGENFFRYTVMCALTSGENGLIWKDVENTTTLPTHHYAQVENGVIARFNVHENMQEGQYLIRITYEGWDGSVYNLFRTVNLDRSIPYMRTETFSILKRYDGQNVRFYAGALFNEPVRSELILRDSGQNVFTIYPAKTDSLQVWALPNTVAPGPVSAEIIATNNSNLTYHSPVMNDVAEIVYELVPTYGYEPQEAGGALVTLNRFHDFNENGLPEFLAMELPASGYGNVKFYEFAAGELNPTYSYTSKFMPLDMGTTNDAGQEVLGLNLDTVSLYETLGSSLYPSASIWSANGISGGTLSDYSGDGIKDILLVQNLPAERVVQLYRRLSLNEVSQPKITLRNNTPTTLRNMFVPTVIVQNLDGDNRPDILTADTDGDVMIFEATSSTEAEMTWGRRLAVGNTYYLTTGDFDGNGTTDFLVGGYHTDVLDPNQNYWFFEGYTRSGNNQYASMGYFQFNQVMSQNAVQSYDLDGDGRHEIILALSPNLYVVKFTDAEFKPVFYGNSNRTYQIAVWTQDGTPHFMTNRTGSDDDVKACVWTSQTPFTGPPTPANLTVTPVGESRVELSWQDSGAHYYRVFRREGEQPSQLLEEVYDTAWSDLSVLEGVTYYYAVSAWDSSFNPSESYPTQWLETTPMPQPMVTEISMIGASELRVVFNQPMSSAILNPGCFRVDHEMGNPLSVNSVLNQTGIQLRFRSIFHDPGEPYTLYLSNITGMTGVAPSQTQYTFGYNPDYTAPYILGAEVQPGNKSVRVTISEPVLEQTAGQIGNYELVLPINDSDNSISAVQAEGEFITVTFAHELKFSNQLYYLILRNITDLAFNPLIPNQNICSFYRSDINSLDRVVAYPNPVKYGEYHQVNFMNFPPDRKGKIAIYNTSGDLVYEAGIGPFNPGAGKISHQWDLRNKSGRRVSSGIYYYVIRMGGETKKGKIAVLN